jgi:imidazolonepropionase-like amidohydrolase
MKERRAALLLFAVLAAAARLAGQDERPDPVRTVRLFDAEVQIAECWQRESARAAAPAAARCAAIEHVTVVTTTGAPAAADRTVTTAGGRIVAIAPSADAAVPADALRIDGRGKFLVPGLVDMHVHRLASMASDLLFLFNGITTVRDMDGYPWMLRQRRAIAAGRLLAPTPYIAGHILNFFPMDGYATVVRTPAAARQAVREQAQAGYDFVKIHNALPRPIYDAVFDEAKAQHLDVVGHVPHDIPVAHAIASGQRTLEHLKGYVLDSTLEISTEDWLTPTRGADVWITPTLYCPVRTNLRGQAALDLLASDEMRYAPALIRGEWRALADQPVTGPQRELPARSAKVFDQLRAASARFLVGTDSGGGYDFMVTGFATHCEMELLEQRGMAPLEVLDADTRQAALALRREREFGAIAAGLSADLVLLDRDPAASAANLRAITGVMVRGIWLARADLDRIAGSLRAISAATAAWPDAPAGREAFVRGHVERLEHLAAGGFVLPAHAVDGYAAALALLGFPDLARRCRVLVADDLR